MSELPSAVPKRRSTGWLRVLLILFALAGCVICLVLIRLSTPADGPARFLGTPLCAATGKINCDFVLNSRWANIGGIPTSIFGLVYFALIALWYAVVGLPNYRGRYWHLLPLITVIVGFCGSLGFLYVLAFQLPVWCTWCVAAHVANLWILIFTILGWPRRPDVPADIIAREPCQPSGARVAAAVICAALLLWDLTVTILLYLSQVNGQQVYTQYLKAANNAEYAVWRYRQESPKEIPIRPDDLASGPADAPFTLVVFGDFQCLGCRQFRGFADKLTARFPDRLRCVFKNCPLSAECNRHMTKTPHYFACAAARAAEAARATGTPEQASAFAKSLYQNAERLDRNPYERLASEAGIDRLRFAAALQAGAGRERIEEDVDLAHDLGVGSTPALFLNGRPLQQWNIVIADRPTAQPVMDMDKTFALWERLLTAE